MIRASIATAVLLGSTLLATPALGSPRKIVVAGPDGDSIAARVQKELDALGFETVRLGPLDQCARGAVVMATQASEAIAATCSDGDQVGVWVTDGSHLRLRDVVVIREDGERGRENTAVRAAEVTRATIELREAEEERPASPPPAPPPRRAPGWETFDRPVPTPKPKPAPKPVPAFLAGVGFSGLMGVDAQVPAFSAQLAVGLFSRLAATARLEYPVDTDHGPIVAVAPAFAGGGIEVPLLDTSDFLIPRLGLGAGAAWIRATTPLAIGILEDSVASFALHGSAGISMRVYQNLRLTADGIFGSTTSRLVARDLGRDQAYWGTPFGAIALRAELMIP